MAHPGIPRWQKPYLRDAATLCRATFGANPRTALVCELDAGHDGKHKDGCARWSVTTIPLCIRPTSGEVSR